MQYDKLIINGLSEYWWTSGDCPEIVDFTIYMYLCS